MKSSLRFAFVFILLSGCAISAPPTNQELLQWHKDMAHVPLLQKGCFQVIYPSRQWVAVTCATQSRLDRTIPLWWTAGHGFVGNGTNYSAEVTSGQITTSVGSFDRGIVTNQKDAPNSQNYSLQLNSQPFDTPLCAGADDPKKCKGLQQFVYVPTNSGYIQYWLLNYGPNCPKTTGGNSNTNWNHVKGTDSCTRFSHYSTPPMHEPITDLMHLSLGGTALPGKWDILTVRTGGLVLQAFNEDNVLGLACGWKMVEFGVFGNGNSSNFEFNPGTTLTVRTTVDNGTKKAPKCVWTGLTAETNNLDLVEPCCTSYGGNAPAIVFTMSNAANATPKCAGNQ